MLLQGMVYTVQNTFLCLCEWMEEYFYSKLQLREKVRKLFSPLVGNGDIKTPSIGLVDTLRD